MSLHCNSISSAVSHKFANMGLICAVMVVVIHSPQESNPFGIGWWWTSLVQHGICNIAVPFFFFASGYFIAGHMEEDGWWKREIIKRIQTLLIPFMICNILFSVCNLFARYATGNEPKIIRHWLYFFSCSIGIIPFGGFSLGTLWFIRALIFIVLISPLLKKLANPQGLMVLFGLYAVFNPYPFELRFGWYQYLSMNMLSFCGIAWFTLGIYFRRHDILAPPPHLIVKQIGC